MVVHEREIYIRQLLDAISTIYEFTAGMTAQDFVGDKKTFHACLMILVHIGEICATMQRYNLVLPVTYGQKIIDMRNFLAHQYIDIRPSLIAKTVFEDVPSLEQVILADSI
jgi:uncharacterized protein with HEPN domain